MSVAMRWMRPESERAAMTMRPIVTSGQGGFESAVGENIAATSKAQLLASYLKAGQAGGVDLGQAIAD